MAYGTIGIGGVIGIGGLLIGIKHLNDDNSIKSAAFETLESGGIPAILVAGAGVGMLVCSQNVR